MKRDDELWLCLHFSQLALEVFHDRDSARPAAVIEQRVLHCANRENLEVGLEVTTAYALYPDLLALERQPLREMELLQNLAALMYGFTPAVTMAAQNSLLLEIGSCRRLYRGIKPLLEKINAALSARQHCVLCGFAHTPKAAWLLARYPHNPALLGDELDRDRLQQQLAAIPIGFLEIDGRTVIALQQMGVNTLGDLRALPAAALAKRFGTEFMRYLQKLYDELPDPRPFFVPTPIFQQGFAFIDGIHHCQMLLFPMRRLLQMLCDYLRVRQLHCHQLRWQLFDAHALQAEIIIELSRTQNDKQTFLELTRIKLEQVVLREAVFSVSLYSADFFENAPLSSQLFPDANDYREAGFALLDRLKARLGNAALQQLQVCAAHWPEHSWRSSAPQQKQTAVPKHHEDVTAATVMKPTGPRPLWLLPQPTLLRQRDGQPLWKTPLILLRGPERIDNHWWCEAASERDYYVARTHDGSVCWIFFETETRQWFLHGWFA